MNSLYLLGVVYKGRLLVTKYGLHGIWGNEGTNAIALCLDPTAIQCLKDGFDRIYTLDNNLRSSDKIVKKYPIFGEIHPLQNLPENYDQYASVINLDTEELESYDNLISKDQGKKMLRYGTMEVYMGSTWRYCDAWKKLNENEGRMKKCWIITKSWTKKSLIITKSWRMKKC